MKSPDVRRWTGIAAFAVALFLGLEAITKLTMGHRPELDQSDALVAYIQATRVRTFIVILSDTVLMAWLIVFLACFRQLVTRARRDLQWIADIFFAAGVAFICVTLVGDAMDGGSALDVVGLSPDPSAIRALTEGHAIMFGSTGAVLLALVSGAAAYLTFISEVVPRWIGVLAGLTAVSNLLWAPIGFLGTSPVNFFAAGGFGNALFAVFPWLAWVICVGITTVPSRGYFRVGTRRGQSPGYAPYSSR